MTTFTGADGLDRVTMGVENDGVGPAEIRSAEISIAGKSVPDAEELLKRFDIPGGPLALASLTNVMLRSGQRLDYFDLRANSSIARQVNNMVSAVQQHEIVVSLCYCSVFNECWTVGSPNARPRPVQQCPAVRTPYE